MKPVIQEHHEFKWNRNPLEWISSDPEIMRATYFAGQELIVIQDADERPSDYIITYLGFASTPISGIEQAMDKSSAFAVKVLELMTRRIKEQE